MPAIIATPELLLDARAKYHALVTGTATRVVVDSDGSRVEFTAANKQALYNYISDLTAQLAEGATVNTTMAQYHPATFTF